MTSSQVPSAAFERLVPEVQRWVWRRQWTELRDIQDEAIRPILDRSADVVIASATASGKTEAAFLPICSDMAGRARDHLCVLYISPLKALINDQWRRLEDLFDAIDAPVTPWHGDVAASRKRRLLAKPGGVLLITPESLEALFVRRGVQVPSLLANLRYVVVDELHAFIGQERGRQLQSLLHRVELAARTRIPRIGLSATLGDMDLACEFLRPRFGAAVVRIVSTSIHTEVRLQVRGYRIMSPDRAPGDTGVEQPRDERDDPAAVAGYDIDVADDIYKVLRGGTHIVFANQRGTVEHIADLLRRQSESEQVPNEFLPHHGNLSKEIREDAEEALRSGKPATVVATTTLELGIDVGAVDSIAQVGAPQSVTSMRQRLGRSGRRDDDPSVLRIYVQEDEITDTTPPQDQLRSRLVQTIAMVNLLVERWIEPPPRSALHLSTLVQQVLSLIAQHGGFLASQAWEALCDSGPFMNVDQRMFAQLLRDLAAHQLISQTHDDTIVLDLDGERLVNHYEFYAAFASPDEYRLVAAEKTLGTLPVNFPLVPGTFIVFAGRRWLVASVDDRHRLIHLSPAPGGQPPLFGGTGPQIHERVRREMRRVYLSDETPSYVDSAAIDLLAEGREAFHRFGLERSGLLAWGRDTLVFPWTGDAGMHTLLLGLVARHLVVGCEGVALLVSREEPAMVAATLGAIAEGGLPNALELADLARDKVREKHHRYLSDALLSADYASSRLAVDDATVAARRLCSTNPEAVVS